MIPKVKPNQWEMRHTIAGVGLYGKSLGRKVLGFGCHGQTPRPTVSPRITFRPNRDRRPVLPMRRRLFGDVQYEVGISHLLVQTNDKPGIREVLAE
jgi:hypothetical protein